MSNRRRVQLTPTQPSAPVTLDFDAVAITVSNPTGSPVYIRIGGTEIPVAANADQMVPAAAMATVGAVGRWFGVALGQPSLVTSGASAISGLETTATVTFIGAGEIIPQLGSISFQTLSLSDLLPLLTYPGPGFTSALDLQPWGGAIVTVFPAATSGQGTLQIQVSADGSAWQSLNVWAIWPDTPIVVTVPRTLRYLRAVLSDSGIPGDATITGQLAVRATLQEIDQLTYSQIGTGLAKAVTVSHLGVTSNYYVTAGLPAVGMRWQGASGNPLGEAIWYTGPTASGPWAAVAFREQTMGGASASMYRSIGNLDTYLRVDILDTDVIAGGLAGTLTLRALSEADLTSYLQNIYAALGDVGQGAPNVNQSIYHLLASQYTQGNTANTSLATLASNTNVMVGALNRGAGPITPIVSTPGGAIYGSSLAFLVSGLYIPALQVSFLSTAAATGTEIIIGTGPAGLVPVNLLWRGYLYLVSQYGVSDVFRYDSSRCGGFQIPANQDRFFVQTTVAGTAIIMTTQTT